MARKGSLIAAMKATSDQIAAEAGQMTETAPVVVQEAATPKPEAARARARCSNGDHGNPHSERDALLVAPRGG
jgi:hypothetical protein